MNEKNLKLKARIVLIHETQKAFCIKMGWIDSYISGVITGHNRIGKAQKKRIAKALDCNVEDIF